MTRNYDVFFVFGKEKSYTRQNFFEELGELPGSQFGSKLVAVKNPDPKDPEILDLRMQILDLKAPYLEGKNVFAPQSAISNLKLGTRPKGGRPQDKS